MRHHRLLGALLAISLVINATFGADINSHEPKPKVEPLFISDIERVLGQEVAVVTIETIDRHEGATEVVKTINFAINKSLIGNIPEKVSVTFTNPRQRGVGRYETNSWPSQMRDVNEGETYLLIMGRATNGALFLSQSPDFGLLWLDSDTKASVESDLRKLIEILSKPSPQEILDSAMSAYPTSDRFLKREIVAAIIHRQLFTEDSATKLLASACSDSSATEEPEQYQRILIENFDKACGGLAPMRQGHLKELIVAVTDERRTQKLRYFALQQVIDSMNSKKPEDDERALLKSIDRDSIRLKSGPSKYQFHANGMPVDDIYVPEHLLNAALDNLDEIVAK